MKGVVLGRGKLDFSLPILISGLIAFDFGVTLIPPIVLSLPSALTLSLVAMKLLLLGVGISFLLRFPEG